MNQKKEIKYYVKSNGLEPYTEWFNSIKDAKTKAVILTRIDRLKLGNMGDCEPVGQGLSELKIHYGAGYRIYFGQIGTTLVILLCGGDKSTQKKDIKKAHEYWNDLTEGDYEKKSN